MSVSVAAKGPWRRSTLVMKSRPEIILLPLLILSILVVWELVVIAFSIHQVILPRPTAIAAALVRGFSAGLLSRAGYYLHIAQTLSEALAGYAIGCSTGVVLAVLVVHIPLLEKLVKPLIVAFQSVPRIAIAPLLVVWFGFGIYSKIIMVILVTFFPLFINGLAGFKSVDEERLDLMRSFAASDWQIFRKVTFPTALPFIFAGLEVALVHALTGAIVAEFLGGQLGLGVLIIQMEQVLDVAAIFAVLVILGVIGALLNFLLNRTRQRVLFWAPRERSLLEK